MSVFTDSLGSRVPPNAAVGRADYGEFRRSALKVLLVVTIFFLRSRGYSDRQLYRTGGLRRDSCCGNGAAVARWSLPASRTHVGETDKTAWVRGALVGAGVLTVMFLWANWRRGNNDGMVLGDFSNPSVGFFFMITGIRLHMAGGVVIWRAVARRLVSQTSGQWSTTSLTARSVALSAGVWLVVFGLLFSEQFQNPSQDLALLTGKRCRLKRNRSMELKPGSGLL